MFANGFPWRAPAGSGRADPARGRGHQPGCSRAPGVACGPAGLVPVWRPSTGRRSTAAWPAPWVAPHSSSRRTSTHAPGRARPQACPATPLNQPSSRHRATHGRRRSLFGGRSAVGCRRRYPIGRASGGSGYSVARLSAAATGGIDRTAARRLPPCARMTGRRPAGATTQARRAYSTVARITTSGAGMPKNRSKAAAPCPSSTSRPSAEGTRRAVCATTSGVPPAR